ncbi:MAG TPA: hypothetical protein VIN10_11620, partial [Bacteroidales bacterium]
SKNDKPNFDITLNKKVEVKIHRYEKALFGIDTADFQNGLKGIQQEFLPFLAANLDDTVNVNQLYEFVSDTQLISLYNETMKVFPNLEKQESQLSDAFSRFAYFFPDKKLPSVYSYVSDMYYELPVVKNDTVMVVALDVYLGADFPIYSRLGLPYYRVRCMAPEYIPVDVMKMLYFDELAPVYKQKTLLDRMIDGGKMMVYLDAVLPNTPDSLKIAYPQKKLDWAIANEKNIWGFLIENNLLYSTDYATQTKLIQDGPFTTGFSNDSPARLGIWLGWQIVSDYVIKHPEISLEQLFNMTDSQQVLKGSGYKP